MKRYCFYFMWRINVVKNYNNELICSGVTQADSVSLESILANVCDGIEDMYSREGHCYTAFSYHVSANAFATAEEATAEMDRLLKDLEIG